MKNIISILIIVLLIFLGIFLFTRNKDMPTDNASKTEETENTTSKVPAVIDDTTVEETAATDSQSVVITHTNNGYTEKEITIKKGQTVTFLNESDRASWPASAYHPTHTVYPEKTNNDCLGSSFDACRGLEKGESWSFTFNKVGTWGFHDHLNASQTGKVVVTE